MDIKYVYIDLNIKKKISFYVQISFDVQLSCTRNVVLHEQINIF